jgi:glucose/arabinose dehydrogenase
MRIVMAMLVLLGGVMVAAQQAPQLPPPFSTPSSTNRPVVVEAPAGARLQVPAGFSVEPWATGFEIPRYLLQGPGGEILLTDSGSGTVYAFAGGNAAGKKPLITGLKRPYGLALWRNYLYVAETESVKRYPYDAKALTAGKGEEVVSLQASAWATGRERWCSIARDRRCMSGSGRHRMSAQVKILDAPRLIDTTRMAAATRSS